MKNKKARNAVDKVLVTGKELTIQAARKIKDEGYK